MTEVTPEEMMDELKEIKKQIGTTSSEKEPEQEEQHLTKEYLKEKYDSCPNCKKEIKHFAQDNEDELLEEDEDEEE